MRILGVIAEYNPFHNGHLYHLNSSKKSTGSNYTVVVMSPNFVQRGAPAISDKWTRTKMALLSGVDLVIELPTPYATASAEFFSSASVSLLHHTGIVDTINFGSESNHIDLLSDIAHLLANEPKDFQDLLKNNLRSGISFPSARAKALVEYSQTIPNLHHLTSKINEIIQAPNNILAIEYLKSLEKLNSKMTPSTTQRKGSDYHNAEMTGKTSSATAIRREISKGNWQEITHAVPPACYSLLQNSINSSQNFPHYEDLSSFLCYRLLFSSQADLQNIMGINEGMENRILNVFQNTQTITGITSGIKSKRFTQTALQRMLLNIVLQITKQDFYDFQTQGGPQYIRILGFKKSSAHLLTKLKAEATLPIVMNVKKDYSTLSPLGKKMLDIEIRSTNIYNALQQPNTNYNLDFTHPLVII